MPWVAHARLPVADRSAQGDRLFRSVRSIEEQAVSKLLVPYGPSNCAAREPGEKIYTVDITAGTLRHFGGTADRNRVSKLVSISRLPPELQHPQRRCVARSPRYCAELLLGQPC